MNRRANSPISGMVYTQRIGCLGALKWKNRHACKTERVLSSCRKATLVATIGVTVMACLACSWGGTMEPDNTAAPVSACRISWNESGTVTRGGWGRMISLTNGDWLCVSTRFTRSNSALRLHISTNVARSWVTVAEVVDGGRFLDNGELIPLPDGAVLLTGRSLIEGESYRLPVYRSPDAGRSWTNWSVIAENEGVPGTLKERGLWEPHFYFLADGRLAVAYANEKHASAKPAFSQVCSVKVSPDLGRTWGSEITLAAETGGGPLRPGMPVVERMADGRFLAVYEVVGVGDADVFCKTSDDGERWPAGLGTRIEGHHAGPWVTSLADGRLLLTSCANVLSCSEDCGRTWHLVEPPAWDVGPGKNFTWPAIYQTGSNEVAVMVSWQGVKLRFGNVGKRVAHAMTGGVGGREDNPVIVHPTDTGAALVNPDMGWTMHFYSNVPENYGSKLEPADTLEDFPGLSTVYLRVPWAFLEPEEGRFNWALFDTPAQRWIASGKRVAFRVTCSENWLRFATPEWVRNAGAKGTFYEFGKGPSAQGGNWDPDFADPVFLARLDRFLAAMAARYDGNPSVAFVDIGTFGLWGEGHTMMSSQVPAERTLAIVKQHIDLHRKHFPRTLLCISDDVAGHDKPGRHFSVTDYARSHGVTLRDDSILVQPPPRSWYHAEMAQEFWPRWPVILEHEHYGSSKERGAWGDGSLLLKAVEDYHASYLSIHWWPRVELEENRVLIERINRRLGYRLRLREMSWPREIVIGRPFLVRSIWGNAGVAPCYPGGFVTLTLKDEKDGIVSVLTDEQFNVRDLVPGADGAAPLRTNECQVVVGRIAPATRPGNYSVFVSVGQRDGTPRISLPLAEDDGRHRYRIGQITLRKE